LDLLDEPLIGRSARRQPKKAFRSFGHRDLRY
jgi:hypothetical protein